MDTPLIYERIKLIMAELGAIAKSNKNKEQGFDFQSIDDFYNQGHDVFVKQGVFTACEVISERSETVEVKEGRKLYWHVVHCRYTFYAPDGSNIKTDAVGKASDYADKAGNKAMAYAHKYAMKQLLIVNTKDDEDGDFESPGAERRTTGATPTTTRPESGDTTTVQRDLEEFMSGAVSAGRLTPDEYKKEMAEFSRKPDNGKGPYAAMLMQKYARA